MLFFLLAWNLECLSKLVSLYCMIQAHMLSSVKVKLGFLGCNMKTDMTPKWPDLAVTPKMGQPDAKQIWLCPASLGPSVVGNSEAFVCGWIFCQCETAGPQLSSGSKG